MGYALPAVHTRQVTHGDSSSPSPFAEPVKFEAWDSPAEPSTRRLEGTPAPSTNTRHIQPATHEPGKREMMVEDRHSSPTAFTNPPSAKPWTSATGFISHSSSRASPTPSAMGYVQPTAYESTQRTIVGAHHTSSPTIVNPPTTAAFHQRSGVEESPNSVFSSPLAQEPLVPGADLQSRSGQRPSSAADEVSASSPISVSSKRRLMRGQTRPSEIDSMAVVRLQRDVDEKIHAIEQKHAQQMQSLRADHAKEILDLKFSFQTRMVNLEERFARFEEAAMGIDDDN
ncbi:hypothetical protein CDV31_016001 [Fusarium ambrosium]|uniref:Uncharacterized protein n=1 Tax=Fusarium ambrosium TaxID=131363 RepID=A0A428SGF6_9HYPO|nr:hypothetical protein CDV31_016001 [Fusarium ambrosium]